MPTTVTSSWNYQVLEPWIAPDLARTQALRFDNNLVIPAGTLLGQLTSSGKVREYDPAASNGVQNWQWIARYSFKTDASGNIALGGDGTISGSSGWSVGDILHPTELTEIAYWKGAFKMTQLYILGDAVDGTSLAATVTAGPAGTRVYGIGDDRYLYIP